MSITSSLFGGFSLMASLIVAVGAQNTFVLRQGLRREHVGAVVSLCTAADVLLSAVGVAGLGTTLDRVPGLSLTLTLGGSAFLSWYAAGALRRALEPGALDGNRAGAALPLGAALKSAAGFTFLNPHVYLDTVLFLGTIGAARSIGERPYFVLGAAFASAVWFSTLGYGARVFAPFFARPGAWRVLDGLVALTMITLAVGLVRQALLGVH